MISVNSLSSGMSSSFMGIHFPADHNIFACVEQEAYKREQEHSFGRPGMEREILEAYNWLITKVGKTPEKRWKYIVEFIVERYPGIDLSKVLLEIDGEG